MSEKDSNAFFRVEMRVRIAYIPLTTSVELGGKIT
jgi:hypothetical protein